MLATDMCELTITGTSCPSGTQPDPQQAHTCYYTASGSPCQPFYFTGIVAGACYGFPANGACPEGQTANKQNGKVVTCEYKTDGSQVTQDCPSGFTWNQMFSECTAPPSGGKCPPGSTLDNITTKQCIQMPETDGCTTNADGSTDCGGSFGDGYSNSFPHEKDPALSSNKCATIEDQSKCDLISNYIQPLVDFMAALAGVAVVISIVIGGIQYSSSAGDSAKASAAKNRIRNSLVALVAFGLLYALLQFLLPGGLI